MIKTIFQISVRNLVRQKRRSLLLGIAIAFGAMILVVANSFSRGISDVLFNQIVVYVSGHISVNFSERGNYFRQIFYDKDRIDKIIRETVPELTSKEESIGVYAQAIGNGKSDNVVIVGMDLNAEMSDEEIRKAEQNFRMIEGDFNNLRDTAIAYPLILAKQKAEYLNVTMGDIVRVRFTNALGQDQAARLTVVGIFKPANIFMAFPIFVELSCLKPLMGYGPNQTAPIYINIKNPKRDAARLADSLHQKLKPLPAFIPARLTGVEGSPALPMFGFKDDSSSTLLLDSALSIDEGTILRESVFLNRAATNRYGLSTGDTLRFTRMAALDSLDYPAELIITGVVSIPACTSAVAFINPSDFYGLYYPHWPVEDAVLRVQCELADTGHPLAKVIAPQWELMERSRTTKETQQRFREMSKLKTKAVIVDVRSMYETASAILQLEGALNLITAIAVLVLFFIILIGVVNTLRMSVKERTREIGTIRAIGMQRKDIRALFIMEATLLAFCASIAGTAAAFGVMWLLKLPTFDPGENPMGMLLTNGHLHFTPSAVSILVFIALISGITALTAWRPAQRAADMQPSHALRHFE